MKHPLTLEEARQRRDLKAVLARLGLNPTPDPLIEESIRVHRTLKGPAIAYEVVSLVRELEQARPDHCQPVTEEMVESLEELWWAFDGLRHEWLPYMNPTLRLAPEP